MTADPYEASTSPLPSDAAHRPYHEVTDPVRQFTPKEAIRTGMLPLVWISVVMTAGVSIFGISFQVDFARDMGFGPLVAASSMGVMTVVNGVGRGVVGRLSDR